MLDPSGSAFEVEASQNYFKSRSQKLNQAKTLCKVWEITTVACSCISAGGKELPMNNLYICNDHLGWIMIFDKRHLTNE